MRPNVRDGEPVMSTCPFHPFSAEYLADPYPTFASVREETPAFYSDELDMWVVTRYRDASMVMSDTEQFSASNSQDPLLPFCPEAGKVLAEGFGYTPVMTNLDPPEHARIRRHNMTAFSTRRVANLEPVIREIATSLLDDMLAKDRFDWVAGLAYPAADQRDLRAGGLPRLRRRHGQGVGRGTD